MTESNQFKEDVLNGLSSENKYLPSKYFYDAIGDKLFVKITELPEYYLTKSENEIFENHSEEIISALGINDQEIEIVELGAGDGHKAVKLLEPIKNHPSLTFIPIDISENALAVVEQRFEYELPEVEVKAEQGEYFSALENLNQKVRKVILFLGSNMGNMSEKVASVFLMSLSQALNIGDKILLGLDQKKSKDIVLPAYNDSQGVTRDFNLNLLRRINNELGGNFDLECFEHKPEYDEELGEARSYLVSKIDQEVTISSLQETFFFNKGEKIHTEISQKYDKPKLEKLLHETGLEIVSVFHDSKGYFGNYILEKTFVSGR